MAAERPDVSVVIPTHNRWPLLRRALHGALGQDDVEHEVIVVDDGSGDETPKQLAALAEAEPRLRVLRHDEPRGVARARNAGIGAARGTWVAFLDDDDVWSPRKLRAQLDAAAADDADFAYGTYVVIDANATPLRIAPTPDPATVRADVLRTNPIGGPSTFMAKRDVLERVGGFDESVSALADWDLLIRLAHAGRGAACSEVVAGYVEHGENMMSTKAAQVDAELELLRRKYADLARGAGVEFGDLWTSMWRAKLHRDAGRRGRAAAAYARRAIRHREPGDFVRALTSLLGPRVLRRGRRLRGAVVAGAPPWLAAYAGETTAGGLSR